MPCDPRAIDIDFAATLSNGDTTCPVTTNNLGGLGPTTGRQEMRYRAVGSIDRRKIDLVVRATTWYAGKVLANGCDGQFGTLGVYEGTGTDFEFQFQDTSTGEPVVLPHYYFTFFDFDHGGGKEIPTLTLTLTLTLPLTLTLALALALTLTLTRKSSPPTTSTSSRWKPTRWWTSPARSTSATRAS